MKYLLVLVVVGVVLWLMFGRGRSGSAPVDKAAAPPAPKALVVMLACAHCGVNLPRTEAAFDAAGRPFCGDAHRIAGPR